MKILAIGHRKNTGKDTLARFIATRLRMNNRRMNIVVAGFADELKDTCYRLYSWAGVKTKEYYEEHPKEKEVVLIKLGKSARQLWIDFGNHCRALDPNIWVKALLTKPNVDVLIIKDMGFINEVNSVLEHNGFLVKTIKNDAARAEDDRESQLDNFNSWDMVVDNNGSLDQLNIMANTIVEKFQLGA